MGITNLFVSCVLSMQCMPPSRHHRKHMGSQSDSPDKENLLDEMAVKPSKKLRTGKTKYFFGVKLPVFRETNVIMDHIHKWDKHIREKKMIARMRREQIIWRDRIPLFGVSMHFGLLSIVFGLEVTRQEV
ncbi:hypothetical protein TRIUR3_15585 [Triticum urartu]|uniref:Uncharacterized protein n=1 Tax=Triticum urartu TaxID=4572 RepID=M7Z1M1_TRIUA|nr:hypothetical protein TRIUR3_15585 [Triticum urartu]